MVELHTTASPWVRQWDKSMTSSKIVLGAASGAAGGAGLDVDEVFSTYLYTGTGSEQSINNGLDFGEGGSVWIKRRDFSGANHHWFNTASGRALNIMPNQPALQTSTSSQDFKSFNNNGFTLNATAYNTNINVNNGNYVSWSFRKAPKFFDVVTYTGDGSTTKTVSHSLGSTPALIFFKRTDADSNWVVYHANTPASGYTQPYLRLNATFATTSLGDYGNSLAPTSTVIRTPVHTNSGNTNDSVNVNGATYAAYIFAHNNNDGTFGPSGDQDIVKCGSYTGNASGTGPEINLGFEPQWLLVKNANNASGRWLLIDNMRGWGMGDADLFLNAHLSDAEMSSQNWFDITPTGFKVTNSNANVNGLNQEHIYMAIRRGGMSTPTVASDVFAVNETGTGDSPTNVWSIGFAPDMNINTRTSTGDNYILNRFVPQNNLYTNASNAEASASGNKIFAGPTGTLNLSTGWWSSTSDVISWSWKRAPSYFDVVAYTGASGNQTINHNLGVVPEMIWIKKRSESSYYGWPVYWGTTGNLYLNQNYYSGYASSNAVNHSNISATTFEVNNGNTEVNDVGETHIAYLFASLAGISKVGSFTHSNSSGATNVDCGFSNGARLVIFKRTDSTGDWYVVDSVRGITSGNDPYLELNTTDAEATSTELINPLNAGFTVQQYQGVVDGTYLFYAIAA